MNEDVADLSAAQTPGNDVAPPATPEEAPTGQVDVPPAFAVRDAATANWLVRRVVEAREHAARVKAWADAELRRARRDERQLLYLFGQQLEDWVRAELDRLGRRRRSVFLPDGQVGYRRRPGGLYVEDEAAALAWARVHRPEAMRVTMTLQKSVLREAAERERLAIPGTRRLPPADEFFLR